VPYDSDRSLVGVAAHVVKEYNSGYCGRVVKGTRAVFVESGEDFFGRKVVG
jgi:hypothetical protein